MRHIAMWAVFTATIVTSSCSVTRSINPLYTDKDLVGDLQLEGRWTDDEASEVWDVRKDGSGYLAVKLGAAELEALSVHVVNIGPNLFLDLAPKKTPSLAIEAHLFLKMQVEGDQLVLQSFDWDWLQDKAAQAGLAQFELPGHQRVLTASTADVQQLLAMYADDPRALDTDVSRLHRVR